MNITSFSTATVAFSYLSAVDNRETLCYLADQAKLYKASKLCSVETIQLTCENPVYTFNDTGLLDLFTGLICSTIVDSTTTSINGNLVLPYNDTSTDAALLISQFNLDADNPCSYVSLNRTIFGGSAPVNLLSFSTTFEHIKLSRHTSGIQFPYAAEIELWKNTDNSFATFFIIIEGIDFTLGSEKVRLTASQEGPVLQNVTCCRYSNTLTLDLPKFIEGVNPNFNLDSWSYFGSLAGRDPITKAPLPLYSFIFLIQKSFPIQVPFFHHKLDFALASGFSNALLGTVYKDTFGLAGGYQLTVCANAEGPSVTLDPWSLSGLCDPQIGTLNTISVGVTSGNYGEMGTKYRIEVVGSNASFVIGIDVTDVLGLVKEGMGPDSFLLNWITPAQRAAINAPPFSGDVEKYLESGADDMECQGSYYFSQPLLRVDDFLIVDTSGLIPIAIAELDPDPTRNSVLWFDSVTQSYDANGIELLNAATWDFFAIKFLDEKMALMVTRVGSPGNGDYYLANLFREPSAGPTLRWNMNDIEIKGITDPPLSPWTSTKPPNNRYFTKWAITLSGSTGAVSLTVDATIAPAWPEQEACTRSSGAEVCKYEGFAVVTGTVLGGPVITGNAWIETAAL
jgi:hypothetical protein